MNTDIQRISPVNFAFTYLIPATKEEKLPYDKMLIMFPKGTTTILRPHVHKDPKHYKSTLVDTCFGDLRRAGKYPIGLAYRASYTSNEQPISQSYADKLKAYSILFPLLIPDIMAVSVTQYTDGITLINYTHNILNPKGILGLKEDYMNLADTKESYTKAALSIADIYGITTTIVDSSRLNTTIPE